jgi:cytochrome c oxidase subunit 2
VIDGRIWFADCRETVRIPRPPTVGVGSESVRKGIVQLVAIGVVIGVLTALVAVLFQWLPASASEEFDRIQDIYWFATWMSVVIFAIVAAVVVFSVWKWRVPPDDDAEGPPIHGHTGLEIAWTAVPAILVIALGIVSAVVLSENSKASANQLEVRATGQQFAWKFEYPELGEFSTGELVLPVDQQARFTMEAVDVIHSFWVPNFGQKMDAVPGIETTINVTPTKTGEFAVVCAELCGLGHATMRAKARVVTKEEFDAWIEEQNA